LGGRAARASARSISTVSAIGRPHVSDDNPYSEAQFKTLKYRPDFPERFGSLEDARAHSQQFFQWYNGIHRHSGIGFMTPETVHYGRAQSLFQQRTKTLNGAFLTNPKRFKGKAPHPHRLPIAAWINPPKPETPSTKTSDPSTVILCNAVSQSHRHAPRAQRKRFDGERRSFAADGETEKPPPRAG
jgi:hypothetical protein